MSFRAKDLHFDSSQPAFLQRLRGQLAGGDTARHEQPVPRNKRMKQDDEDDAPTYVLEETNQSLTKEEYDALVSGKDNEEGEHATKDGPTKEQDVNSDAKPKEKDKIAEVGANAKKRKVAKIISDEPEQSQDKEGKGIKKEDSKVVKKPKKKTKAVKLTFGDEEEG
ncbi:Nn.00g002250.m01.CDS01 [Neocucurbitaria sp. VM-36]